MKKLWFLSIVILSLWLVPFFGINSAWAQVFDGLISRVGLDGSVFDVYGKIGYQRISVNLNVPVPHGNSGLLFDEVDAKLAKQDLAIGVLGISAMFGPRFGLFAEASVSALTSGKVEVYPAWWYYGGSGFSWDTGRVRWWEVNLGGSVNFLDSGRFLFGYKCDRLTQKIERSSVYWTGTVWDEELHSFLGDLNIQTWSPYVGFRFDDQFWRFDLIWSPWLTSYRAQMPLQWIVLYDRGLSSMYLEENRYSLDGSGGNLLEAYAEAQFNVLRSLAAKLWGKASWLNCRGSGERDLEYYDSGFFGPSESQSATGSLTRYLWAVGIAGDVKF